MKELLGLLPVHNSTELCNNGRKLWGLLIKDNSMKATGTSMRLKSWCTVPKSQDHGLYSMPLWKMYACYRSINNCSCFCHLGCFTLLSKHNKKKEILVCQTWLWTLKKKKGEKSISEKPEVMSVIVIINLQPIRKMCLCSLQRLYVNKLILL